MKKPVFVQVEIPPGYEVAKPPEIDQNFSSGCSGEPCMYLTILLRRKVSTITKNL